MLYNVDMSFGKNVAKARDRLDMTQEELGEAVGVTSQAVSQWERGIHDPELDKIPAIARKLKVPVSSLFADDLIADLARRDEAIRAIRTLAGEEAA